MVTNPPQGTRRARPGVALAIAVVVVVAALAAVEFVGRDEPVGRAVEDATAPATSAEAEPDASASGADTTTAQEPEADEPATSQPSFDVVAVSPTGEAVIAGRAEPGATVTVLVDGQAIATVIADERGEFVVVPETPLVSGAHTLTLEAETSTGVAERSTANVVVEVPASAGGTAMVAQVASGDGVATQVLQSGAVGLAGAAGLTLDTLDVAPSGDLAVSGRALPGRLVAVYVDGKLIGNVTAAGDGRWTLSRPGALGDLAAGHEIRVDMVDASGAVIDRVASAFVGADLVMPPADSDLVVIRPGDTLWHIAHRTYGGGLQYTLIFRANSDQISDPDLIFPGQVFLLPPATAN
ncbi:MAG: Ig-like domain-containing protein [Alphaproteobacteria bacterium]